MVDFTQELRHRCRNPKCRTKLKPPVENDRHAFCTPGCYSQFYFKHCIVCENGLPTGSTVRRLICKRAKCKSALRAAPNRYKWPGSYPGSQAALNCSETPIKSGLKTAHKHGSPLAFSGWRRVGSVCPALRYRPRWSGLSMGGRRVSAHRGAQQGGIT